jgi:hypothetical protein
VVGDRVEKGKSHQHLDQSSQHLDLVEKINPDHTPRKKVKQMLTRVRFVSRWGGGGIFLRLFDDCVCPFVCGYPSVTVTVCVLLCSAPPKELIQGKTKYSELAKEEVETKHGARHTTHPISLPSLPSSRLPGICIQPPSPSVD